MFYPTILINETNERHIVKDKNYCVCGAKYNGFFMFTRIDLRKIRFKQDQEITCPTCKALVKQKC